MYDAIKLLTCSIVILRSNVIAWDSIIYKSKLLCGSIIINMVCELKITAGSLKNCVKIPW